MREECDTGWANMAKIGRRLRQDHRGGGRAFDDGLRGERCGLDDAERVAGGTYRERSFFLLKSSWKSPGRCSRLFGLSSMAHSTEEIQRERHLVVFSDFQAAGAAEGAVLALSGQKRGGLEDRKISWASPAFGCLFYSAGALQAPPTCHRA